MAPKLAVLSLLLLLGSVACQDFNGAPSANPTASPRPSNIVKRISPMHPPSSNQPAYPSSGMSPSSSAAPPVFLVASSPSPGPSPTTAPAPRPSHIMKRVSPMHPPISNAPAYPPPGTSPSSSTAPPVFPVASNPTTAAPAPRPSHIMKRVSPMHPPSSNAPAYPPPGLSTSSSATPPVFPVPSSPGLSPTTASAPRPSNIIKRISPMHPPSSYAPTYPPSDPNPSSFAAPTVFPVTSSPGPSPTTAPATRPSNIMKRISPMHPPSSNAPAYPPPGLSTSSSATPPVFPVTSSLGPSPTTTLGPRPSNIMKRISPMPPPSSNAPAYPPPGPSPSSSPAPPVFPVVSSPGLGPSSSVVSGPTASPSSPGQAPSGVRVGYYSYSCPNAEAIVRAVVKSVVASNPGMGAGLIRLLFHDCFVQGCDASVLLNTTGSADPTERQSPPNLTLRGFEVIDAAKAALEAACPGVVSCADVVAFASRDATHFLSGGAVDFRMPAGRYDGRVSRSSDALANLPPPTADLQLLKDKFAAKGLDTDDMVTLSGAHTVGVSHCSSFSDRLPPNNASSDSMNPTLAASLSEQCNGGANPTVVQDLVTPNKLDSQYYWDVLNHDVLFSSDAALLASNQAAHMVSANAFKPGLWEAKFKKAMVKMSLVDIKTSADGEIRQKCWMINN